MSKFVQCFVKSKTGKPKITQISFSFGFINIFRSHLNAIHITLISIYLFSNVNGFWKIWHKISEYLRRLLAWEWEISYSFHILGTRTTNNICSQTILALSFNESSMKIYTHNIDCYNRTRSAICSVCIVSYVVQHKRCVRGNYSIWMHKWSLWFSFIYRHNASVLCVCVWMCVL